MWSRTEKTDYERYLKEELEDAQAQLERDRQERQAEIRERRNEERERFNSIYHETGDWPEALRKQAHLFAKEAGGYDDDGNTGSEYNRERDGFAQGVDACNRAYVLYAEVEKSQEMVRGSLLAQLSALDMAIRQEVASELRKERNTKGWLDVANTLADPDADPSEWLNW